MIGSRTGLWMTAVLFATASLFMTNNARAGEKARASNDARRAEWMSGGWGVRFLLPGGERPEADKFDVEAIMAQLRQLKGPGGPTWVGVNVTNGACGSLYTGPHPLLDREIHPNMAPQRDLLGEMLDALRAEGFRTLVYFASEGPTGAKPSEHHLTKLIPGHKEKWAAYSASLGMDPKVATARVVIEHYSKRYGRKIDGWWFDHAVHGDPDAYAVAARAGNPDAALAFNLKHEEVDGARVVVKSHPEEDFTAGHPTPMKKQPPWSPKNERMIESIERGPWIDGALGHAFVPMQRLWTQGDPDFPTDLAIEWTRRVARAGGALTWAVATERGGSTLAEKQFRQLLAVKAAMAAEGNTP